MRELIPAVKGIWAGDYAHDGEFFKFPSTTSAPKPLQQPNPPIWVAARDPNSHEFAVANGCNVQVTPLWQGDDEVLELRPWDAVRVAPGTVRAFEGGPDGLELLAIGSDRPEGGDGVRVDEWWSD